MRGEKHLLSTAVYILSPDKDPDKESAYEHLSKWNLPPNIFSASHPFGRAYHFVETTEVYFRSDLSDEMLAHYIQIGEARNCAGGYMMEQRGAWLIEKIKGDWQNVIGLPIFPLTTVLRHLGVPMFGRTGLS